MLAIHTFHTLCTLTQLILWKLCTHYLHTLCLQCNKPRPIMVKILPIMLLSSAQKVTHYTQCYAHNYCNYATVLTQSYHFNDYISIVRLQAVVFYIMLCCSVFILTYYAHKKACASFYTMLA